MPAPIRTADPQLDERLADVDPALLEYAIGRDIAERQERRRLGREVLKRRRLEQKSKQKVPPVRSRYRKLRAGETVAIRRPLAKAEDRKYVPAALRHWRLTHDLTPEQAQARVGLSTRSCSWRHYEDGFMAPPYLMLLKIIAATGLGTNLERLEISDVAPELRLEHVHADYVVARKLRSRRRLRAKQRA